MCGGYSRDIGPFALLLADGGNAWAIAVCGSAVVAAVASVVGARRFWPGVGAGTLVGIITMITYLVMLSIVAQSAGPPPSISLGDYAWWILNFLGLPVVAAAALAAFVSGNTLLALEYAPCASASTSSGATVRRALRAPPPVRLPLRGEGGTTGEDGGGWQDACLMKCLPSLTPPAADPPSPRRGGVRG
jgi:hypothetical protein